MDQMMVLTECNIATMENGMYWVCCTTMSENLVLLDRASETKSKVVFLFFYLVSVPERMEFQDETGSTILLYLLLEAACCFGSERTKF